MTKKSITILAFGLMLLGVSAPVTVNAAEAIATEISIQEAPSVKVRAGGIVIDVPGDSSQHVVIYALTGQVIKQLDVPTGKTNVDLPAGYYIVRVGHATIKVAVR